MWASFTKEERTVIVSLATIFAFGSIVLPFVDDGRKPEVFTAESSSLTSRPAESGKTNSRLSPGSGGSSDSSGVGNGPDDSLDAILPDGRIDLNKADAELLETLPDIGMSKAETIVSYRKRIGAFRSFEDLDDVPGIGPSAMKKLRPLVSVSPPTDQTTSSPISVPAQAVSELLPAATPYAAVAMASAPPPPAGGMSAIPLASTPASTVPATAESAGSKSSLVNINTATVEELATLYRIGEVLAQRIVDYRQANGPFPSVDALDAVKGIGKGTIEQNRSRLTVR